MSSAYPQRGENWTSISTPHHGRIQKNISEVDADVDQLQACNKLNEERIYTWPRIGGSSLSAVCVQRDPSDLV